MIAAMCVALATNAGAYEVDFHYYVIYLLIRAHGYPPVEADQLAGFSQYVDDNAKTEPLFCTSRTRAAFHFAGSDKRSATTENLLEARDELQQAFARYSLGSPPATYVVGAKLHLLADTFSHATFTAWWNRDVNCRAGSLRPCIGHADEEEDGHAPDRPYNAPLKALRAAEATYQLIPPPISGGSTTIGWTSLQPELAAAFNDYGRVSIIERTNRVRRIIEAHFNESPHYDKIRFRRKKSDYEAAVMAWK